MNGERARSGSPSKDGSVASDRTPRATTVRRAGGKPARRAERRIEVTAIATIMAAAGTIATAGEENAGSCGATTSCETLWQFLSCGSRVGSGECVGQWQCAGSGQQQRSLTVVDRAELRDRHRERDDDRHHDGGGGVRDPADPHALICSDRRAGVNAV